MDDCVLVCFANLWDVKSNNEKSAMGNALNYLNHFWSWFLAGIKHYSSLADMETWMFPFLTLSKGAQSSVYAFAIHIAAVLLCICRHVLGINQI